MTKGASASARAMQTSPTRMRLAANSAAVPAAITRRHGACVRSLSLAASAKRDGILRTPIPDVVAPGGVMGRFSPSLDMLSFSTALLRRNVIPLLGARIELTRTADLLLHVLDHFLPLGDPADRARKGEQG